VLQNVHLLYVLYTISQKYCLHPFYTNINLLTVNPIPSPVLRLLTLLSTYSGQWPQAPCHLLNEFAIMLWLYAESCIFAFPSYSASKVVISLWYKHASVLYLWSSWMWHRVVWLIGTRILEEHATLVSMFRVHGDCRFFWIIGTHLRVLSTRQITEDHNLNIHHSQNLESNVSILKCDINCLRKCK
jgi:hypothetical protein